MCQLNVLWDVGKQLYVLSHLFFPFPKWYIYILCDFSLMIEETQELRLYVFRVQIFAALAFPYAAVSPCLSLLFWALYAPFQVERVCRYLLSSLIKLLPWYCSIFIYTSVKLREEGHQSENENKKWTKIKENSLEMERVWSRTMCHGNYMSKTGWHCTIIRAIVFCTIYLTYDA